MMNLSDPIAAPAEEIKTIVRGLNFYYGPQLALDG